MKIHLRLFMQKRNLLLISEYASPYIRIYCDPGMPGEIMNRKVIQFVEE